MGLLQGIGLLLCGLLLAVAWPAGRPVSAALGSGPEPTLERVLATAFPDRACDLLDLGRTPPRKRIRISGSGRPPNTTQPGGIQDFDLLSETHGWLLAGGRLFWTGTAGLDWREITPENVDTMPVQAAFFLDAQRGWSLLSRQANGGTRSFSVTQTLDGGRTWQTTVAELAGLGSAELAATAAHLFFVDLQAGWLVFEHPSSSNFSVGSLFVTRDGGQSWQRLSIPLSEPVGFVTRERGWLAGGAAGDELHATVDGGQTWVPQDVVPYDAATRNLNYYLPTFQNEQEGVLPVAIAADGGARIDFYLTRDGGRSWDLGTSISLGPEIALGTAPPVAVVDVSHAFVIGPGEGTLLKVSPDGTDSVTTVGDPLQAGLTRLNMATATVGWAQQLLGGCESQTQPSDGSSPPVVTNRVCVAEAALLRTLDGGQAWTPIRLPLAPERLSFSQVLPEQPAAPDGQTPGDRAEPHVGQGFDKCEIPSLAQLQTWQAESPYSAVNLYIGGSCRACRNSALTAAYVSSIANQGWRLIPTWVGPQTTCWAGGCGSRISDEPAVAYQQGVDEANAAVEAAAELGLTSAEKSGTVIYYDLETTGSSTCRAAARAFASGWVSQLHARGNLAGLYGSTCGTTLSDFSALEASPDAVWAAHWIYSSYTPDAAVWGLACLADNLWSNHQRIRQYAGPHNELWGGLALTIDSNVLDGFVARSGDRVPPTTTHSPFGASGEDGWYRSDVQITLTADDGQDGTGVRQTEYRVDGQAWTLYQGPFTVSGEGSHTLLYRSVDNASNREKSRRATINIDSIRPSGSLTLSDGATNTPGVLIMAQTQAIDTTSGISAMRLRNAGSDWHNWQDYTSRTPWQLPDQTARTHTVEVQFRDRAGNTSVSYSDEILLDVYPPRPASRMFALVRGTWGAAPVGGQSPNHRLVGTVGQPSPAGWLSSANYRLSAGFWSLQARRYTRYLPLVTRMH